MKDSTISLEKLTEEQEKRFLKARKSFEKMQKEIAPYIKRRKFKAFSTAGEWRKTSSLYS